MQHSPSYLGNSFGASRPSASLPQAQLRPQVTASVPQFTSNQPQATPQFTTTVDTAPSSQASDADVSDVDWDVFDYVPDVTGEDVQVCMTSIDGFKGMLTDVTTLTNISIERAMAIAQKINSAPTDNPAEHLAWVAVLAEELGNEEVVDCVDIVRSYLFDQQEASSNGSDEEEENNGSNGSNGTNVREDSNGNDEITPFHKTWYGMGAIGVGSLAAIALSYWAYKKYWKGGTRSDFDEEDLVLGAADDDELEEEIALNPRPRVRLNKRRKKRKNKSRRKPSLFLN